MSKPEDLRREETLQTGLNEFYSAQAEVLLSQYRNIESLLGPAGKEWKWPGTHCEVLIRDFLRRVLPSSLSVDTGYMHGLRYENGEPIRCPELDIVVHDTQLYSPLFRLDDFVIVRPQSVRAVLQIKRRFDRKPLHKAVENLVAATEHHRLSSNPLPWQMKLYTGALAFEDSIVSPVANEVSSVYMTTLRKHVKGDATPWLMPNFIGSLRRNFLFYRLNTLRVEYEAYPSFAQERNIALTFFVGHMLNAIMPPGTSPNITIVDCPKSLGKVSVWEKGGPDGGSVEADSLPN